MEGYREASDISSIITVFPERKRSLFVQVSTIQDVITDRDHSGNPGFTYLRILAMDRNNIPVGGAHITLYSNESGLIMSDTEFRTDADGYATIKLTVPDIDNETECHVLINATKGGFYNASQNASILVVPYVPEPVEAKASILHTIGMPLAIILLLVSGFGAAYYIRRKNNPKK